MLARLAENLFWAGRYLERAEDTARLVDVTFHTRLEGSRAAGEEAATYGRLLDTLELRALYVANGATIDQRGVTRFLVAEEANPGSIRSSLRAARENARSLRELISSELWQAINDLHLDLSARDLDADLDDRPSDLLTFVRQRCLLISGVAQETMQRDEGWRFFMLGRQLERVGMMCRLLAVAHAGDPDPPSERCVATLRSASAFEAYRRVNGSAADGRSVLEFLLFEPDFPRSVLWSLRSAEAMIDKLAVDRRGSRAARALGRVRSSLEFHHIDDVFEDGIGVTLDDIASQVEEVATEVADEFFRHLPDGTLHAVTRVGNADDLHTDDTVPELEGAQQ